MLRLEELYVESFDVHDVKASLKGDHLARAIGTHSARPDSTHPFAQAISIPTRVEFGFGSEPNPNSCLFTEPNPKNLKRSEPELNPDPYLK